VTQRGPKKGNADESHDGPTELDVPPLQDDEDGEATRLDPKPVMAGPFDEDEATKYTGTPKKARAAQRILAESKKMAERGGPEEPAKRVHPLVALGTAFFLLAALLWVISWLMSSSGS
jgi:hypothetical protein